MERIIPFGLLRNKATLKQPNEESIKASSFGIKNNKVHVLFLKLLSLR